MQAKIYTCPRCGKPMFKARVVQMAAEIQCPRCKLWVEVKELNKTA